MGIEFVLNLGMAVIGVFIVVFSALISVKGSSISGRVDVEDMTRHFEILLVGQGVMLFGFATFLLGAVLELSLLTRLTEMMAIVITSSLLWVEIAWVRRA